MLASPFPSAPQVAAEPAGPTEVGTLRRMLRAAQARAAKYESLYERSLRRIADLQHQLGYRDEE